jgi:hypothetical protein
LALATGVRRLAGTCAEREWERAAATEEENGDVELIDEGVGMDIAGTGSSGRRACSDSCNVACFNQQVHVAQLHSALEPHGRRHPMVGPTQKDFIDFNKSRD